MDSSAGAADVPAMGAEQRSMTVRGAAFLGVGSMVGAGIFALLGEAGAVAGSAVWLSVGLVLLLLANLVDLTAIASLGSVVALGIILLTSLAALPLRHETDSNQWVIGAGIAATAVVLVIFGVQTLQDSPQTFTAMIGIVALAVVLDLLWSWVRTRRAQIATGS